ncbi:hypothetical protein [Pseudonocardia hydrocarbonoxydans]|uniref:hypothetical protein n=1 Tax=Pseudonocardia hydrocarbonoxydans TaxID=76726 RepID=UPI001477013B|nr:hypothetical protein [Pseudonocardia hydrocarbonoxydans]
MSAAVAWWCMAAGSAGVVLGLLAGRWRWAGRARHRGGLQLRPPRRRRRRGAR